MTRSARYNLATFAWIVGLAVSIHLVTAQASGQPDADLAADATDAIRVGLLVYGGDQSGQCFSDGFLADAARRASLNVSRELHPIALDSETVFEFPLVVFAGAGPFTLTPREQERLGNYLTRGGMVLASARCSDAGWAESFRHTMNKIFPDTPMMPLDTTHPVFHTLYDIGRLRTRKTSRQAQLWGLTQGDRLVVVFSPDGLHDARSAGPGCCCCGGNEVRDAHRVNANILGYALTH